ncbi:hypothetical protein CAC01_10765 [Streptomyces sp. CLI2509]|nr:hypothetical protein CAC01_10765 [Streptomyces sp. CLI2509]MYX23243.1 NAD-dependent epimerase/dehydratase family protein [Streptomyces sp. SID8380]
MTHPIRMEAASRLAEADTLGRVCVVTDPEPDGPPTALRSAALAWQSVNEDATHHLVLQDDVVLAEGFFTYAERVAAAVPDEAVAFYAGWEGRTGAALRMAALAGQEWTYAIEEHSPCLALMLPADVARGYTGYAAEEGRGWPYDVVMQRYLNSRGVPIRVSVPSTVDHSEVPSIAGNSTHGWRQSPLFTHRAPEPTTFRCTQFATVPFYQYGLARTALRQDAQAPWQYIETERYLQRVGLGEQSSSALAAAGSSHLPERVTKAVWETAFAMGAVIASLTDELPTREVLRTVLDSVGPGGLCEDYTADDLRELIPAVGELALTAFEAGRRAQPMSAPLTETARVAVIADEDTAFSRHLTGLLGDLGYRAANLSGPLDSAQLKDSAFVVHLGTPRAHSRVLADVLSVVEEAGVERFVHISSAAIYRGLDATTFTEDLITGPPDDAQAREWWEQEDQCRRWGREAGIPVQILRLAEPVGPGVFAEGTAARWIHRAWTRRPLSLDRGRRHQVLDHGDVAGAITALLAAPAGQTVFNVASETYSEEELAELVAVLARRMPWHDAPTAADRGGVMSTELAEKELGWHSALPALGGLRALAQWLACDVHDAVTGLPQIGSDV